MTYVKMNNNNNNRFFQSWSLQKPAVSHENTKQDFPDDSAMDWEPSEQPKDVFRRPMAMGAMQKSPQAFSVQNRTNTMNQQESHRPVAYPLSSMSEYQMPLSRQEGGFGTSTRRPVNRPLTIFSNIAHFNPVPLNQPEPSESLSPKIRRVFERGLASHTSPDGWYQAPQLQPSKGQDKGKQLAINDHTDWPTHAYTMLAQELQSSGSHLNSESRPVRNSGKRQVTEGNDHEDGQRSQVPADANYDLEERRIAPIKRIRTLGPSKQTEQNNAREAMSSPVEDPNAKFWATRDLHIVSSDNENGVLPNTSSGPYQSLQHEDSIRLLRLEPGRTGTSLHCTLVETRLSHLSHEYESISYVWGGSTDRVTLYTPDGSINVTKNLSNVLLHLRWEDKPRYLWADAACINQKDMSERNHQVTLMRQIYMRATKVLLWLGPDIQNKARMALSVICSIASGGEINGQPLGQANFYANGINSANILDLPCRDAPPKDSFKALWQQVQTLFDQSWFWRVWCIQEVALARTAEVLWGDCSVSWRFLGIAAARLRTSYLNILHRYPMPGVFNAYLMYRISASQPIAGDLEPLRFSFPRLLALTRQFESSDPRDRIYGLLGIPTTDTDPERGELYIKPNYEAAVNEVYTEFAIKALKSDPELNLLASIQHGPEIDTSWPSWVPHWDKVYTQSVTPAESRSLLPSASEEISFSMSPRPTVSLQATLIASLSECLTEKAFVVEDPKAGFESHPNLKSALQSSIDRLYVAFTLSASKSWYGLPVDNPWQHTADFYAYLEHFSLHPHMSSQITNHHYQHFEKLVTGTSPELPPPNPELLGSYQRFVQAARNTTDGRALFFTSTPQNMLGLGPLTMRPGDIVSLLHGAAVPYLLRPTENYNNNNQSEYRLIGECYVHGIEYIAQQAQSPVQIIHII